MLVISVSLIINGKIKLITCIGNFGKRPLASIVITLAYMNSKITKLFTFTSLNVIGVPVTF